MTGGGKVAIRDKGTKRVIHSCRHTGYEDVGDDFNNCKTIPEGLEIFKSFKGNCENCQMNREHAKDYLKILKKRVWRNNPFP